VPPRQPLLGKTTLCQYQDLTPSKLARFDTMRTLRSVNRKAGKRRNVDPSANIDGRRIRRFFTPKSTRRACLAERRGVEGARVNIRA
jgi:hypothetical protein